MKTSFWPKPKWLALVALSISAMLVFAACSSADEESTPAASTAPVSGATAQPEPATVTAPEVGTIVNVFGVTLPADAAPLNQQFLRDFYINEGEALEFAVSVYNAGGGGMQSGFSLAMLGTDLSTVPGAALSWSASDDLKTWTFNIDPDLN